jgi:hypothetical protein
VPEINLTHPPSCFLVILRRIGAKISWELKEGKTSFAK